MNEVGAILNHPFAHRLGWALFHSLWQGALAAGLFAVLRAVLRRHSANSRYVAGCALLLALAAAPVLTLLTAPTPEHAIRPGPGLIATGSGWSGSSWGGGQDLAFGGGSVGLWEQVNNALEGVLPWVVLAWLLGVCGFGCRWAHGAWWVRNVRQVATQPLEPDWLIRLDELRARLSISRPVRLLKSAVVEVPGVVGWLRPVILLPSSTLFGLTPSQVEAILAHELAHVRRWDYVVNAFQTLVETLMFYHPAVWWISRCIREEREHCCDDLVVRVCGDRVAYARALYTLESMRGRPQLALAATGGSLLFRIRRLLGAATDTRPPGSRELGGFTALVIGCVAFVAGVGLMFQPATYQARTVLRVEPDSAGLANGEQSSPAYHSASFLETEMALMRSPVVLNHVPREPASMGKAAETLALDQLRSHLALRRLRDTTLIEIVVSNDRAEEAARLANAVAAAYQQHRVGQRHQTAREILELLQRRIAQQSAKIDDEQEKLDKMRDQLGIADASSPGSAEYAGRMSLSGDTLRRIDALRIESKAELVREETLLEKLRQLKPDELVQALPATVPDSLLSSLQEQLTLTEQKLIGLSNDFGPEHPERVKVLAQINDLQKKIRLRTDGILTALETKAAATKQNLKQYDAEIAQAVKRDLENASYSRPYWEAKRKLEEMQRFRGVLVAKETSERAELELPGRVPVEVVEQAVVPLARVNPHHQKGVGLMGGGVLLALVGVLLARSGRERRVEMLAQPA